MKVKNVMFTGFAAAVLAFACNSADAAVRLATEELVETKQAKLNGTNVTTTDSVDGANVVTAVTADNGAVTVTRGTKLGALASKDTVATGDLDATLQGAINAANSAVQPDAITGLREQVETNTENIGEMAADGWAILAGQESAKTIADAISDLTTKTASVASNEEVEKLVEKLGDEDAGLIKDVADLKSSQTEQDGKISGLEGDVQEIQGAGYLTATTAETAGFAKTSAIPTTVAQLTDAANYVTDNELTGMGYITEDAIGKANFVVKKNTADTGTTFNANATENVELNLGLANVATSGSYDDLSDKPTIPSIDGLASEEYVDNSVATRVAGTLPVQNGTYLVSSNGTNVTWTAVEVIGADGNALTLTSTATGADSGVQQ